MLLLKDKIANAHNFIATKKCVSSMLTSQDFQPEIKTGVAKEGSTTGYKYTDRFISKQVFFVNQA